MQQRSPLLRSCLAAYLTSAALGWAGTARSQALRPVGHGRATLVVTRGAGSEDCPNAVGFADRVRAITANGALQTNPLAETDTWIYLELAHDLGRYNATLQTRGRREGSRTLSDVSANCASLAEAVAVTLAVLLDANEPSAAPGTKVVPAPTPATPPREQADLRVAAVLGGGVGLGLLAEPAPWGTGGIEATLGSRIRLGVGAGVTLPQRVHYQRGYTELNLAWGYARGCALAFRTKIRVELMLCISPMLGVLSGSGKRYDFSKPKRWSWVALAGGPQLAGPLASPSFWWLSAMLVAPITLRGFQITVDGEPHDTFVTSSVAATASLGMGVYF
jgi:hypothetical protein